MHVTNNQLLRKWSLAIGVNVLLGIPAVIPLFLAWYILVNGPLAALGWTLRDPNEDDGMLLWLVIGVPVFGLFGLIWALVNRWIRRRTAVPPSRYWTVCAIASVLPFAALLVFG